MLSKKLCVAITVAISAAVLVGCTPVRKDSNVRSLSLGPSYKTADPMVAELVVGEKKVQGAAAGKAKEKADLEKKAIYEALKPTEANEAPADVLVAASYFYSYDKKDLSVVVIGYPARYRKFRTRTDDAPPEEALEEAIGSSPASYLPTPAPAPAPTPALVPAPAPTPAVQEMGGAE